MDRVSDSELIFRIHAVQRMFQRQISETDVRDILANGEVIEGYPDDLPYPSRLMLGRCRGRPLHVLASDDLAANVTYVITVYEPDAARWDGTFKRRR